MARLVLDSSALIEIDRGNARTIPGLVPGDSLVLPVVVLAELLVAANHPRRNSQSKAATLRFIDDLLESAELRLIDQETAVVFAELKGFSISTGKPRGTNDLWIAASTIVAGAELKTLDRRAQFEGLPGLILRD
jgi:tRNA(fMet)-specific endonuclease VapC